MELSNSAMLNRWFDASRSFAKKSRHLRWGHRPCKRCCMISNHDIGFRLTFMYAFQLQLYMVLRLWRQATLNQILNLYHWVMMMRSREFQPKRQPFWPLANVHPEMNIFMYVYRMYSRSFSISHPPEMNFWENKRGNALCWTWSSTQIGWQ